MATRPEPRDRHPQREEDYRPRTPLGERLWKLRQRVLAAGERPLDWEGIEKELAELRGLRKD